MRGSRIKDEFENLFDIKKYGDQKTGEIVPLKLYNCDMSSM